MTKKRSSRAKKPEVKEVLVFAASTAGSGAYSGIVGKEVTQSDYVYGEYTLDPNNKFKRWQQITSIDPYVSSSLMESSRVLGKGLSIGTTDDIPSDKKPKNLEKALEAAKDFAKEIDLKEHFCQSGLLLMQDGTLPILKEYPEDTGMVEAVNHLPMICTTMLPKNVTPQEAMIQRSMSSDYIMKGPVKTVVLNEALTDMVKYDIDEVELIRNFNSGYLFTDILNRPTLGMYGRSLIEPIETTVKYRQNILFSYEMAIMRYGHLKLWFDYEVLGKMLENHNIELGDAKRTINEVKKEISKIKANEDIITSGMKVQPIETTSHMDVTGILEALEKTISNMLCSTPSGSGKGAGDTFASSYMAENRKVLVMEGIRTYLKTGYHNILWEYLEGMGYEDCAEYVEIKLDPIVEPELLAADLQVLHEKGLIDDQQYFDLLGINVKPQPEEYQKKKQQEAADQQLNVEKELISAKAATRPAGDRNPQKSMLRTARKTSDTKSSKVK